MGKDDLMIFQMMSLATCDSNEFFISHKMNEWMGQSMDSLLVFETYWLQCEPHQDYSKV
jgi:hypothetical protein